MTREEHLKWCVQRAIEEMDYYKDPKQALISMASDLRKHPETNHDAMISLCMMQMMTKPAMNRQETIGFLNGFR